MRISRCIRMIPIVVLCVIAACAETGRIADPADNTSDRDCRPFRHNDWTFNRTPADFRAVHGFFTGTSLGPVTSYAYDIAINRDVGDTIYMELGVFGVDIDPIARAVPFDVSVDELNDLYDLMVEQDVFREYWEWLPQDEWPCGAAGRSVWVRADGQSYHVYGFIVDEDAVMPVYSAMRQLVPEAVWDDLWAWRDEYMAGQP